MPRKLRSIRVEPPGPVLNDETAPGFAAAMLAIADEVAAEERELWGEIERLAAAGDCATIRRVAAHAKTSPPGDVLAALHSGRPRRATG